MKFGIIAAVAALVLIMAGCTTLSPSDKAGVASDAVRLSACNGEAHLCKVADGGPSKCWAEYDACIARFKDGGV